MPTRPRDPIGHSLDLACETARLQTAWVRAGAGFWARWVESTAGLAGAVLANVVATARDIDARPDLDELYRRHMNELTTLPAAAARDFDLEWEEARRRAPDVSFAAIVSPDVVYWNRWAASGGDLAHHATLYAHATIRRMARPRGAGSRSTADSLESRLRRVAALPWAAAEAIDGERKRLLRLRRADDPGPRAGDEAGLDFDVAAWRPALQSTDVVEKLGRLVLNPDTADSSLESEAGAFRRELQSVADLARRALAEFDRVLREVTAAPRLPDVADDRESDDPEPTAAPPRRRVPRGDFDLGEQIVERINAEMKKDGGAPSTTTEPLLGAYERHLRHLATEAHASATRAVEAVHAYRKATRPRRRRRRR
jgi:hypothetical protein